MSYLGTLDFERLRTAYSLTRAELSTLRTLRAQVVKQEALVEGVLAELRRLQAGFNEAVNELLPLAANSTPESTARAIRLNEDDDQKAES